MRSLKSILADQAKAERDERELRSRSDARAERRRTEEAMAEVARTIVGLSDRQLAKLALSEQLLDAVNEARAIRSAKARDRAIRVVRRELRDGDFEAVAQQLEAIEPQSGRRSGRSRG